MSVSCYAYLVYGVIVKKDRLYEENNVRGCGHKKSTTAKFCPECGKPMYKTERSIELDFCDGTEDTLSYYAFTYEEEDEVVLGFALAKVGGYKNPNVTNKFAEPTQEQKEEILEYCRRVDIKVDESELKNHLMLYASY